MNIFINTFPGTHQHSLSPLNLYVVIMVIIIDEFVHWTPGLHCAERVSSKVGIDGETETPLKKRLSWWRHQMESFSALLALCVGNSPVPVNYPHKGQWPVWYKTKFGSQNFGYLIWFCTRLVTRRCDVFFDLRLNKRLGKQSRRPGIMTPL